jgi:hypothetical protein
MVISGDVFVIRSVAVLLQGKMAEGPENRAGQKNGSKDDSGILCTAIMVLGTPGQ